MKNMKQAMVMATEEKVEGKNAFSIKTIKSVHANFYNNDKLFSVKLSGYYDDKNEPIECGIRIREYINEENIKTKKVYHKIGVVQKDDSIKWYAQPKQENRYIDIDDILYDDLNETKLKELIENGVVA